MQIHGKWFATGIVRDISERKRTEESLKSLATKFSTLYESSSDAIMLYDEEGFFDCNPATLRMFRCPTRDDFINKHPSQLSPPTQPGGESSMSLANQRIAMALKNGSNQFDWVHCRLDGTEFPADVLLTAMQLDGKAVLLATVRDITERRLAEESVRIIQARFGTIFNQSPLGIALIDSLTGQIYEVNPRFAEIAGRTIEEMATINWMSITHPDDVQEDLDNMALLNAGKIPGFKMDKRYIRPDGSIVWVGMTIAPLRVEKNISPRHLCMIDDITDRKLTEEKIRQLNEDLEAKVQERTKQLRNAQEELVRKEKLAVLGQVAGSVGHELRNPLGVMSNAVYFLQTVLADADETTKEYLDIINDEIAGSERIVSDLLDSVRTNPPHPKTVCIAELIEQTLRKYTVPSSVTVKLDIPATLSPLRVDAMQIQQVFRNLISNGVEAMPEGGSLEISAVENKQDGTVTVSVCDSGIGMALEVQAKLFQPLFTTKPRGIGLGLVVVKNLTQANGGSVEVQSEVGKGSTFSIVLPSGS
jgi:PAS domain S-box-containing protein